MMRFRFWVIALLAVTPFGVLASKGSAESRPSVAFSINTTAVAGQATRFNYATGNAPAGSRLVLQRAEGTGQVWRTISKLARRGTSTVPALGIGTDSLRLALLGNKVISHDGRTFIGTAVLAQAVRSLNVFGTVPLAQLLGSSGGSITTPNSVFPYAFSTYDGATNYVALAEGASNPCLSVSIDWLEGPPSSDDGYNPSQSGSVTLVQQSSDPVSGSASMGAVTALPTTAVVPGQPWSIQVAQAQGGGSLLFNWYFNGSAVCDRTSLSSASVDPSGF